MSNVINEWLRLALDRQAETQGTLATLAIAGQAIAGQLTDGTLDAILEHGGGEALVPVLVQAGDLVRFRDAIDSVAGMMPPGVLAVAALSRPHVGVSRLHPKRGEFFVMERQQGMAPRPYGRLTGVELLELYPNLCRAAFSTGFVKLVVTWEDGSVVIERLLDDGGQDEQNEP